GVGFFEPRAELRRKPAGKSNPFAGVLVLIIRQLGRSDGASRPGALETRLYPDPWTELCPPATLDPALSNSVLPRTLKRGSNRADGHRPYCSRDLQSILGVPVKDEEPRSRLIREGLAQLLDDPTGGRMGRNVEIHDTPPIVADDEEAIEHTEGDGRNGKEVHRPDGFPAISKKGKPAFCWLRVSRRSFHPAGNRSFRNIETKHEKFAVNTWGAPGGVLRDHPKDQI